MNILLKLDEILETLKTMGKHRDRLNEHLLNDLKVTRQERSLLERKVEDMRRDDLRMSTARSAFVLVLIDGDAAPFLDTFIESSTSGGESAARVLRQRVVEYVSGSLRIACEFEVMIRVYSKLEYLDKTYHRAGILQGDTTLHTFVQGFNRVHPLCDYVDAGNDKEGADRKVQEMMRLFVGNVHCKHVLLCAGRDNSYTGFLRQFAHEGSVFRGITLVESIPFARDLAEISSKFLKTEFSDVFRSTKLNAGPSPKDAGRNNQFSTSPWNPLSG